MNHAPDQPGSPDAGTPAGGVGVLEDTSEQISLDKGWNTVMLNDPVNTTEWVTQVLIRVLETTPERAQQLMMRAHLEGSAIVFHGTAEEAEAIATKLHIAQINARWEPAT